ncbi:MAG TPA: hypothetical protein VGI20_07195 [Rhizomicrobium sp.]|jgi:hypothetical protein
MMKTPIAIGCLAGAAFALLTGIAAAQGLDLKIEMKRNPHPGGPVLCNANIFKRIPSRPEAERFVHVAMQLCVRSEPSQDIVAQILQNGHPVGASIFDGALFYDHKSAKVRRETAAQMTGDAKPHR